MRTCPQRLLKLHLNMFTMDQLHEAVQNYSKKRWTHSYLKLTSIYLRILYCLNVLLWFYLGMYIKKIGTSSNQATNSRQPVRTSPNQFGQPDRNNQIGPANSDHQFGPPKETPITLNSRKIWRPMSTRWKAYEVYFPTQQVSRHLVSARNMANYQTTQLLVCRALDRIWSSTQWLENLDWFGPENALRPVWGW